MMSVSISRAVAANTLFVFGEGGIEPGGFTLSLFRTIAKADPMNKTLLAKGFPEHVAAYRMASEDEKGIDRLREIAGV